MQSGFHSNTAWFLLCQYPFHASLACSVREWPTCAPSWPGLGLYDTVACPAQVHINKAVLVQSLVQVSHLLSF